MIKQKNTPPYYEIFEGSIYMALLTQNGTTAPTAIELINNGSTVTWSRTGIGQYVGTAAPNVRWIEGKTAIRVAQTVGGTILHGNVINDTTVVIEAQTATDYTDNSMDNSLVEILVFN